MGWAVGYKDGRHIGYGVPATCDHPGCGADIDRGLAYACGNGIEPPFDPTPDTDEWVNHVLTDESWAQFRAENPDWRGAGR